MSDPTARIAERLVEHPNPAAAWLAELFDVIDGFAAGASWAPGRGLTRRWVGWVDDYADRWPSGRKALDGWFVLADRLERLANAAGCHWAPPPKVGTRVGGVMVGSRGSSVEDCDLCGDPIGGTVSDPVKRLDGKPYHLRAPAGDALRPPEDRRGSCFRRAWLSKGGASRVRVAS